MTVTGTDDLFCVPRPSNYLICVSRHTKRTALVHVAVGTGEQFPELRKLSEQIAHAMMRTGNWSVIEVCEIIDGVPCITNTLSD